MKKLLIINYHSIFYQGLKEKQFFDPVFSVYLNDFIEQLILIGESGIPVIGLDEMNNFEGEKAIAITFDDGHESDFRIAYPLLRENEMKASFFPNYKNVNDNANRWNEYRELSDMGFGIGSNGLNTVSLNQLSNKEQLIELSESKLRIEDCIGKEINDFSLYGGSLGRQTEKFARMSGYKKLLGSQFGCNNLLEDNYILKRWNITRATSTKVFSETLSMEGARYKWKEIRSSVLEIIYQLIGQYHSRRLNYYINKM